MILNFPREIINNAHFYSLYVKLENEEIKFPRKLVSEY